MDAEQILAGTGCPAFVTDERWRIVAVNDEAAEILGGEPPELRGRSCYEVVGGKDPFGNRFCHENCSVGTMAAAGDPISDFDMTVTPCARPARHLGFQILVLPGREPGSLLILHTMRTAEGDANRQQDGGAESDTQEAPSTDAGPEVGGAGTLTSREREVLHLLAGGRACVDIADTLCISESTVRNHIHKLLKKLGVNSQLEAVSLAYRKGLI